MTQTAHRVFVSYSSEDLDLVRQIIAILEENGLTPMWAGKFTISPSFPDQIKTYIAHAHVFMPVITEAASRRGWVHQEIGYAMALNVPVLPVALGVLPGQMLQEFNALTCSSDIDDIRSQLSDADFDGLIESYRDKRLARYSCADQAPHRAEMLTRYADDVRTMKAHGCVRQKGGLSSFHIPKKVVSHPDWLRRYGGEDRGEAHCTRQRNERIALEKHARKEGCRIIIKPSITYEEWGPVARKARLKSLVEFLESVPDDKAQVAINNRMPGWQSLTMVGDWFAAESVSGSLSHGFRQTIFTRHAPSVESRVEDFDDEFEGLLDEAGWSAETSRTAAIATLNELIEGIGEGAGSVES